MHFPKPFFRPKKNRWYVQLAGKQINLGPDRAKAFRRYHQIMGERKQPVSLISATADPTLLSILDEFLDWCLMHRAKRTYDAYKERIRSFIKTLPVKTLAATDLKPFHLRIG